MVHSGNRGLSFVAIGRSGVLLVDSVPRWTTMIDAMLNKRHLATQGWSLARQQSKKHANARSPSSTYTLCTCPGQNVLTSLRDRRQLKPLRCLGSGRSRLKRLMTWLLRGVSLLCAPLAAGVPEANKKRPPLIVLEGCSELGDRSPAMGLMWRKVNCAPEPQR